MICARTAADLLDAFSKLPQLVALVLETDVDVSETPPPPPLPPILISN